MADIRLSKANHTEADGLADAFRGVGRNQHFDSLGDLKIPLDIAHRQAKIGG